MPEYPGVYIVEAEGAVEPIPGVPTRIDDKDLRAMAAFLRERLTRRGPAWAELNEHDPGVAMLELLAYLAEELTYRARPAPDAAREHVARLTASALALLGTASPAGGGLRSSRFLCGWRARLVRWIAR